MQLIYRLVHDQLFLKLGYWFLSNSSNKDSYPVHYLFQEGIRPEGAEHAWYISVPVSWFLFDYLLAFFPLFPLDYRICSFFFPCFFCCQVVISLYYVWVLILKLIHGLCVAPWELWNKNFFMIKCIYHWLHILVIILLQINKAVTFNDCFQRLCNEVLKLEQSSYLSPLFSSLIVRSSVYHLLLLSPVPNMKVAGPSKIGNWYGTLDYWNKIRIKLVETFSSSLHYFYLRNHDQISLDQFICEPSVGCTMSWGGTFLPVSSLQLVLHCLLDLQLWFELINLVWNCSVVIWFCLVLAKISQNLGWKPCIVSKFCLSNFFSYY